MVKYCLFIYYINQCFWLCPRGGFMAVVGGSSLGWESFLFPKVFICSLSVSFFRKSGPDQQRFLNLVDTILSFLVVPEAKILVSKEGAAGCSILVGKIPSVAGIRADGHKAPAGNGIIL